MRWSPYIIGPWVACLTMPDAPSQGLMKWNEMDEMSVEKWRNEICGTRKLEKPREKPTQTPFRPPRNPHGVTETGTRDPSGGRRAPNRLRHEASFIWRWMKEKNNKEIENGKFKHIFILYLIVSVVLNCFSWEKQKISRRLHWLPRAAKNHNGARAYLVFIGSLLPQIYSSIYLCLLRTAASQNNVWTLAEISCLNVGPLAPSGVTP